MSFLSLFTIFFVLLLPHFAFSQLISHQNWSAPATIVNGVVTVACADLRLPFETQDYLSEASPFLVRGDMDFSLRSPHPVKLKLVPETGTTDNLTTISGCTVNGARVQLTPSVVGTTINVVHTPGSIELPDGVTVILNSPLKILTLQRKDSLWVVDSGAGASGGGSASIPIQDDCSTIIAEGQLCWDQDNDKLYGGDGSTAVAVDQGDITSWFNCLEGACNGLQSLPNGSGLNFSAVVPDSAGEGIILPQGDDCSGSVNDGQICWDNDNDILYIGNSSIAVAQAGGGAGDGDVTDVFNCASGDCGQVTMGDGDLLDMSTIPLDSSTEGLILPQNAEDCSAATAEGQVCWDSANDVLFIGDGTAAISASQPTVSLDLAAEAGRTITSASGVENAVSIGDGTDGHRFYVGPLGPTIECFLGAGTCDQITNVPTGNSFILSLDDIAALTIADTGVVTLGESLKEVHSYQIPASMPSVDGTFCTKDVDIQIGARFYPGAIDCLGNNASHLEIAFPMPGSWDATYLTLTGHWYKTGASTTGNIRMDWAVACAGHDDAQTAYAGEVAMTFAANSVAQNDHLQANTASALTLSSCAKGDMIYLRGEIDATATTNPEPATWKLLYITVKFKVDTWSD